MIKDYYKVLNVSKDSTDIEIKKAYRDLAIKLHPDKNSAPDAHGRFVEVNEAFQVLSVMDTRENYDRLYARSFSSRGESTDISEKEFDPIKNKAHGKAEKTAAMDFTLFISEFLTEVVGSGLRTGVMDGVGTVIKGTGEILGDVISGIDL